jgi:hypothetical protein
VEPLPLGQHIQRGERAALLLLKRQVLVARPAVRVLPRCDACKRLCEGTLAATAALRPRRRLGRCGSGALRRHVRAERRARHG